MGKKKWQETYYDIPEYETIKEMIVKGMEVGGDKREFDYEDRDGNPQSATFRMTWERVSALGTYFYLKGIDGKKKISILADNSYEWIVGYYAGILGGNVVIPLDCKLPYDELAGQLMNCECDSIIVSEKHYEQLGQILAVEGMQQLTVFRIEEFEDYYKEGASALEAGDTRCIDFEVVPEDLCCIVYTSGTTGRSKGVMLSHKNLCASANGSCKVNHGGHAIGFLPLNHTYSWVSALFAGLIITEYGYICPSLKTIQRDLQEQKPYNFAAVPLAVETIYERIWKTAQKRGKDKVLEKGVKLSKALMKVGIDRRRKIFSEIIDNLGGNLNFIISGGAALPPEVEEGMYNFGIPIINGYGITECSPSVTCNRIDNIKFGSVGLPFPCNEIKINNPDETGVGEIYVKGDNVMMGYYNDPEATAAVFDDGWLKTGDYGWIDEDGFLFFRGRKKNLMVTKGGKNVSPEELEDKLYCFPYVAEVLVYQDKNDAITAEFFLKEDEYPDARARLKEDLREFNNKMPIFKQIVKTKIRDEEFPKTTTLKIVRNYEGGKINQ